MNASASRRLLLRRLISGGNYSSQAQLVQDLAAAGHRVTQATVSRDLEALGATKRSDGNGNVYVLDPGPAAPQLAAEVGEFIVAIDSSGDVVVVHTRAGAAHLVAGAIDAAGFDPILGTVAGDDTVMVVAAPGQGAMAVGLLEGAKI